MEFLSSASEPGEPVVGSLLLSRRAFQRDVDGNKTRRGEKFYSRLVERRRVFSRRPHSLRVNTAYINHEIRRLRAVYGTSRNAERTYIRAEETGEYNYRGRLRISRQQEKPGGREHCR